MRCAKLLAYLIMEFEVPVLVRQAIRCARIFFFGLVDFKKLDLYKPGEFDQVLDKIGLVNNKQNEEAALTSKDGKALGLGASCSNQFMLKTL
jgi:hypothetical protein